MARPSKLTPEVQARLVAGIRHGLTHKTACAATGVAPRTFQTWIARGRLPGKANARHRHLVEAVERARAAREADLAARLLLAAQRGSWRAAAWLLERQYPERWGPAERTDDPS